MIGRQTVGRIVETSSDSPGGTVDNSAVAWRGVCSVVGKHGIRRGARDGTELTDAMNGM
ncbi:UNVERIFIED_CONTAM: hypothetical protein Sangu_2623100 [Sesamum angustifolium]|uniref:Uncharacterized protein n=1 Tax=Sesamum angustifolium TaxID=2727405 RepID=A0AAW2J4M5_9LAMI